MTSVSTFKISYFLFRFPVVNLYEVSFVVQILNWPVVFKKYLCRLCCAKLLCVVQLKECFLQSSESKLLWKLTTKPRNTWTRLSNNGTMTTLPSWLFGQDALYFYFVRHRLDGKPITYIEVQMHWHCMRFVPLNKRRAWVQNYRVHPTFTKYV